MSPFALQHYEKMALRNSHRISGTSCHCSVGVLGSWERERRAQKHTYKHMIHTHIKQVTAHTQQGLHIKGNLEISGTFEIVF